jgi:hypothetical protein
MIQIKAPDGSIVQFPPDTDDATITRVMSQAYPAPKKEPERSLGVRAGRMAEFGARGFMDSAAETLGAVPDLLNRGLRAAGVPIPGQNGGVAAGIKQGMQTAGQTLSAPVNAALNAAGVDMGPQSPEGWGERAAYGAGRGVADAASIAAPAALIGRGARAGSVTQGAAQALASQPVTQAASGAIGGAVGEATDSPLAGFAASLGAPMAVAGARRIASPVAMQLTPNEQRLAAIAQREGINLTPGQQTGSRALQAVESSLAQLPFSGNRQNAVYDAQRTAFNKAALAKAGVGGDRVSPDVMDSAFKTAGRRFDDLASRTTLNFDPQFTQDVAGVAQSYGRRLPTDVAPVFQSYMDDLKPVLDAVANGQKPQIDGRTFQKISSDIGEAARGARNRPDLQNALNELRRSLDDVMERSAAMGGANPQTPRLAGAGGQRNTLAQEWRDTRREYRNLLAIDEAAGAGSQADRAAGNLPLGGMRAAIDKQDPRGYARGRHDMAELAQLSDFLAQKIPNSGTPERLMAMRIAQGGMGAGGLGGAMAIGADPLTAALMGTGALATPPMLQAFMNSPAGRAYLTNQRFTGQGPQMNRALAAALLGAQGKDALLAPPQ